MKIAIFAALTGMFGRLFGFKNNPKERLDGDYKKQSRLIRPGRRTFNYIGVDGAIHSVRIGNAFPVRPTHQARFFIATNENRMLLEVG